MQDAPAHTPFKFDPTRQISALEARLLHVSNALHSEPTDGPPPAEPHMTRHAGFRYTKETTR